MSVAACRNLSFAELDVNNCFSAWPLALGGPEVPGDVLNVFFSVDFARPSGLRLSQTHPHSTQLPPQVSGSKRLTP